MAFYDSGVRILADMAAAEREAAAGAAPRGRLRVNSLCAVRPAPADPAAAALPRTLSRDLGRPCADRHVIDLMEERADVAIRAGPLGESRLVARKLGQSRIVGRRRAVLSRRPWHAADAGRSRPPQPHGFPLRAPCRWLAVCRQSRQPIMVPITGNTLVSDGESMRLMALAGAGIARLARWHVAADIAAGRLRAAAGGFQSRRRGADPRRLCRPGQAFAGAGCGPFSIFWSRPCGS